MENQFNVLDVDCLPQCQLSEFGHIIKKLSFSTTEVIHTQSTCRQKSRASDFRLGGLFPVVTLCHAEGNYNSLHAHL